MASRRICTIDGCGNRMHARELCSAHYGRLKVYGDPCAKVKPVTTNDEILIWMYQAEEYDGDDCLIFPFNKGTTGYGQLTWEGRKALAHRVMCETRHGPPPSQKHIASHSCGKGHTGCVNPRHLRWATYGENDADKDRHGTRMRGSKHPVAKLTDDAVREIRSLKGKMRQVDIAAQFGVTQSLVSLVHRGKAWAWLE